MGGGTYSVESRTTRASLKGYSDKTPAQNFTRRSINNAMNPHGITVREARDSDEHPKSLPIILGLDVTGSMGTVPNHLIQTGLPTLMSTIIQSGTPDPQLLFLALGDHEVDDAPLQVAQFESSDELLDKWLEEVYLESGGGSNYGESYLLAWMFAARYTETDHWEKRGEKGFLFTVGDEPCLRDLPGNKIREIMGSSQASDVTAAKLLEEARERYHVYHIHIAETSAGSRQATIDGWKQIMGDNVIVLRDHNDLATTLANTVLSETSDEKEPPFDVDVQEPENESEETEQTSEEEESDFML